MEKTFTVSQLYHVLLIFIKYCNKKKESNSLDNFTMEMMGVQRGQRQYNKKNTVALKRKWKRMEKKTASYM